MSAPGYAQYGDRLPQAGPAQPYAAQYPGNPTGGPAYPGGIPQLYGGVGHCGVVRMSSKTMRFRSSTLRERLLSINLKYLKYLSE